MWKFSFIRQVVSNNELPPSPVLALTKKSPGLIGLNPRIIINRKSPLILGGFVLEGTNYMQFKVK